MNGLDVIGYDLCKPFTAIELKHLILTSSELTSEKQKIGLLTSSHRTRAMKYIREILDSTDRLLLTQEILLIIM